MNPSSKVALVPITLRLDGREVVVQVERMVEPRIYRTAAQDRALRAFLSDSAAVLDDFRPGAILCMEGALEEEAQQYVHRIFERQSRLAPHYMIFNPPPDGGGTGGGSLPPGTTYLVGDRGPEIWPQKVAR